MLVAALQLPESIRGSGSEGFCLISFSYPIPTHSIHNFIALLSTTAASPRKIPIRKNTRPAASKRICVTFQISLRYSFQCSKSVCCYCSLPVSITPLIDTEEHVLFECICSIAKRRFKMARCVAGRTSCEQ